MLQFLPLNCLVMLIVVGSVCSVANWGIPVAAIADAQANPEKISGKMTTGNFFLLSLNKIMIYVRLFQHFPVSYFCKKDFNDFII